MQNPDRDPALQAAHSQVDAAMRSPDSAPLVTTFFDAATFTATHVVRDPASKACALIDSVLDFDTASGRTAHTSAQSLIDFVRSEELQVEWLLETHAHADHLSAAPLLQQQLGGRIAIGACITETQKVFGRIFNAEVGFATDGSQFDHLFVDGESFTIGTLPAIALHLPGHTPACMAYVIGESVFTGDTLFMPDYGTARCDFPGGSAALLYRSIRRLLELPDAARVFLCHDYKAPGRDAFAWQTTIGAERIGNLHVREGVSEVEFVEMREARDRSLPMPKLLLPAVQVNMRGGHFPEPDANGIRYLKLPVDAI